MGSSRIFILNSGEATRTRGDDGGGEMLSYYEEQNGYAL